MNGSYIKIIFELLQITGKNSIVRTFENKGGGHPEIWKKGKGKKKKKKFKKKEVESEGFEPTILHTWSLHAVMVLSGLHYQIGMRDKNKIHC